jgi:sugar phosphate isomerase/epimerase
MTRRTFIKNTAILAASAYLLPSFAHAAKPNGRLGLQLYTLRDVLPKGPREVIKKVAEAGYQDVETYGYGNGRFWGVVPSDLRGFLVENGLSSFSGHYNINPLTIPDPELDGIIKAAKALGQTYVTIPYLGAELRKTADDYKRIAAQMNIIAEKCKKAGLRLAYHNHDFEFTKFGNLTGQDILLQETDAKLVDFELDLYWVKRSGHDILDLFKRYPGRFTMWHVKDMDKVKPNLNTEIGSGSIDFKAVFAQAKKSGLKQFFVEQENFSEGMDPFKSIAQSNQYIKSKLLK